MIKIINYSTKYRQEGLEISLNGDRMLVTKGKLVYDRIYRVDNNVSFKIDDETTIIFLVEDLTTGETLIATSDGSIDKTKYRLIERLAWKTEKGWESLVIKPFPKAPKAGKYNYEGFNSKTIKKTLAVQESYRKTINPEGKIKTENIKRIIHKRKS